MCVSVFMLQDSRGNPHVRAEVAKFIEDRDGVGPSDPNVSLHQISAACRQRCAPQLGAPSLKPVYMGTVGKRVLSPCQQHK
jgi:hypothetical protein